MKGLLRSVIDYGGITQDNLIANFQKLTQSRIEWPHPADKRIYTFLRYYFHQHLNLPSKQTIVDHFEQKKDQECIERVSDHEAVTPYSRTNFTHLLHETLEEQNRVRAITILKEAQEIITKGLIVDEERKQGLRDGVLHFARNTHRLLVYEHNSRIDGNIRDDGQEVWDEYSDAKSNKGNVWGMFCGINGIDSVVKGIKKGEMWVHAAFVGELKTTFALNWAYNLVTRYRKSVLYVTLEMPYEQVRSMIYVMHSSNGKWKAQGYQPLDYDKVKSGELTPEEEVFYKLVIADFNENEKYGRFDVWGPDEDITIDEIQQHAELRHQEEDINLLVIDHGGLLEPRKRKRNKDYTIELNSVLRDTKKLALHFNHGEKIPILVLFQINRDGKDFADKNEGRYKLRALSYANECLEEGTLIRTDLGLIPIESVPVGCQVWSSTGWKPVLNNFNNGVRDLVEVEASNGLVLKVTADHLFRTLDPSGLGWSRARDLAGKHILLDVSGGLGSIAPPILPRLTVEKHEKSNCDQGTPLLTPEVMSLDLAYLMGCHDGDGQKLDAYRVGWTGNRLEVQVRDSIQSKFLTCFGHQLPVIYSSSRPGSFDLMKWSKPLHRWFNLVGMDRSPSVSWHVLRSGSDIQGSYLKGVWDTDGSINNQGNLSLGMSSKKVNLIRQVHLIMLGLGIQCYITQDTQELNGGTHSRHTIWVSGLAAKQRFLEVTGGFTETHKQQRLQESLLSKRRETTLWPVGPIYLKLYTKYRTRGLTKMSKRCVRAARRVSNDSQLVQQRAIEDLLKNLAHVQGNHELDLLRRLLTTTLPVQVRSVTSCGSGPVYDLEVTGDHEYSTGGVLTHNCERSADVVTTTYLNDEHRKEGTTLFDCLKRRDGVPFLPFKAGINWSTKRITNHDTFHGVDDRGISVDDLNMVLGVDAMFQV